ncbi:hypothetical protein M432DRAFT_595785 [Thermoascus aurantiacus ATCC 26904]
MYYNKKLSTTTTTILLLVLLSIPVSSPPQPPSPAQARRPPRTGNSIAVQPPLRCPSRRRPERSGWGCRSGTDRRSRASRAARVV